MVQKYVSKQVDNALEEYRLKNKLGSDDEVLRHLLKSVGIVVKLI